MKVLLISYHFPPDPAVGSTRTGRIARALRAAGHDVHVIAPRLDGSPDETDDASVVHRVRRRRNAREIALALRDVLRRRKKTAASGTAAAAGYATPENVPQWKRFLVAMALFPDDQQGFILPAIARARTLHRQHGFDLLYSSGPPHSAHVAALILARLLRIRWAAEFRDPWTDNAVKPRFARSDTALAMKRWLERKSLAAADPIIAVSEAAGRVFAAKAGARADRVLVIRNGIDAATAEPLRPRAPGPVFRMTYLGNLYHRRDPRPLMRALAALRRAGELEGRTVELAFFGQCRWFHDVSLEAEARALGIADSVRFHDPIPQSDTPAVMAGSDLLLLFAQEQPLQIPQKLYEYFAARRPILAFADPAGETALMLNAAGGHYLVPDDDPERVADALRRALRGVPDSPPRFDPVAEWSVAREMGRLLDALDTGRREAAAPHVLRARDTPAPQVETQTAAGS